MPVEAKKSIKYIPNTLNQKSALAVVNKILSL